MVQCIIEQMETAMLYIILVDGDIDQVCETEATAKREVRDLKKMDCGKVTVKKVATWEEVNAFESRWTK